MRTGDQDPTARTGDQDPTARLEALLRHVKSAHRERLGRSGLIAKLRLLEHWQAQRLEATYPELTSSQRYRAAVEFFLDELYGPKDFAKRDHDLDRVSPILVRLLPAHAVDTLASAVELNALSQSLDLAMVAALEGIVDGLNPITEERYLQAYRRCGDFDARRRQIGLIGELARELDALVRGRGMLRTLRLMRRPAQVAGFGDLQQFLEQGLAAFRNMGGAGYFVDTITRREMLILERIESGHPMPFDVVNLPSGS